MLLPWKLGASATDEAVSNQQQYYDAGDWTGSSPCGWSAALPNRCALFCSHAGHKYSHGMLPPTGLFTEPQNPSSPPSLKDNSLGKEVCSLHIAPRGEILKLTKLALDQREMYMSKGNDSPERQTLRILSLSLLSYT